LGHLGFIATLSPVHFRPELTATEPALVVAFERVGAFAVLGLLFASGYPRRYGLVCVVVLGSAILLELLQILVTGIFAAQWLVLFLPALGRSARTTHAG
jgi:hypothetical protein